MPSRPEIVFIVAVAENGVIGRDNAMPWHLKSDLQRFKALTLNKPVIMGRKTFLSIGRPLPKRTNIVITRDKEFRASGAVVVPSLDNAYDVALGDALRRGVYDIMVIGGADIFSQWMDRAVRLELTQVHDAPRRRHIFSINQCGNMARDSAKPSCKDGGGITADFSYTTFIRSTPR